MEAGLDEIDPLPTVAIDNNAAGHHPARWRQHAHDDCALSLAVAFSNTNAGVEMVVVIQQEAQIDKYPVQCAILLVLQPCMYYYLKWNSVQNMCPRLTAIFCGLL